MKKLTLQEFIEKSQKVHGTKYDYSKVYYQNGTTKVKIICHRHGAFYQQPYKHLEGRGCPLCSHNNIEENSQLFISKSKNDHGDRYDYSMVKYKNARTKVRIICLEHGSFEQTPDNHLRGHGCPKCMAQTISSVQKSTTEIFIKQAGEIHNNYYDYSLTDYDNAKTKVKIVCPKHGQFEQSPDTHLNGSGCPKCSNMISRKEILWLDSLSIPLEQRQVKLYIDGKLFKLDGFDPQTNTIYEFYGDYWHGNPNKYDSHEINLAVKKTFGELYARTIQREKILKDAGYIIVHIWEKDFIISNST